MLFEGIRKDIRGIKERDPAARNSLEVLLLYSGLHAIMMHRPAHWLYKHKFFFLARLISQISRFFTGIEIHPGAKLGHGILIDHGMGVVIGETATVADNCTIYQGVTLGGTGKEKGKRHPDLEEGVMVGSGAKVLGPLTIGAGAKIASGAVVLSSVPAGCTAVGVPARVVRRPETAPKADAQLDQVHIPDPVSQEICRMNIRIQQLEKELAQYQQEALPDAPDREE
ncbi:MAG: serine O-acetyltransferase [Oscillospiraceae bacterium]|nr:serine O-acetyltransferase [Oscillospiraceae bacterium]